MAFAPRQAEREKFFYKLIAPSSLHQNEILHGGFGISLIPVPRHKPTFT